jgi:hypothetical protein
MRRWSGEALLVWRGPDWFLIVSLAGQGRRGVVRRERQRKAVLGVLASNLLSPPPACPL